jgi:glycosyltransferase involved in cell wall biosynthesis
VIDRVIRVAVVSPNPSSTSGGVERFCHVLALSLIKHGFQAHVVASEEARRGAWDCVITNGMVRAKTLTPRVHVFHGCWVEHMRFDHASATARWRLKRTLEGAWAEFRAGFGAQRVAVSTSASAEVARWYGYRKCQVIPNAVDVAAYGAKRASSRTTLGLGPGARLALFPGRPERRKRPDLAVKVAEHAGYQLLHAGSDQMPGAQELGLLTPEAMAQWLAAVDVVLAPSDYEACSIAVLEALATGTPVIATRVGWIRDLIMNVPGYRCLTAERGDLQGLLRAIDSLPAATAAVGDAMDYVHRENDLESFSRSYIAQIKSAIGAEA